MPPAAPSEHNPRGFWFPLWLKLGLVFGTLVSGTIVVTGMLDFDGALTSEADERRNRATRLVEHASGFFDGDVLRGFRVTADMASPEYARMVERVRLIRDMGGVRWVGVYARTGPRDHYVIDSDDADPMPLNYPMFDLWPAYEAALRGETSYAEAIEDEYGRWDSAFAPVRDRAGDVVAVLAVDEDANSREVVWDIHSRRLVNQLAVAGIVVMLVSILFARYLGRGLKRLAKAADAVAHGDLAVHVDVAGHDEVGVVSDAFNDMVDGLKQRDFLRDAFGRYVDREVADSIMADPDAMKPGGQLRTVTILMSDLRGFTSLTARLEAAELVELLNGYLERMAEVITRYRGTVIEFLGDAILVIFGAPLSSEGDALRAVACAAEMQVALERLNVELTLRRVWPMEMGIGVNTGEVIVGNIGSAHRLKYGVVGDPVNLTGRIESFTVGGEVLISEDTLAAAGDAVTVRGPIEVKAKGKKEPLRLFAVVAVGAPYDVQVPVEHRPDMELTAVSAEVTGIRLDGKRVSGQAFAGRLTGLAGTRFGRIEVDPPLGELDNVKLSIALADDEVAGDIYAKVQSIDEQDGGRTSALVRFTAGASTASLESLIEPGMTRTT